MLDICSSSHIHPAVCVALLRQYFGSDPYGDFWPLPLQKKLISLKNPTIQQRTVRSFHKILLKLSFYKTKTMRAC